MTSQNNRHTSLRTFFHNFWTTYILFRLKVYWFDFLLKGSSSYGRPASSVEYKRLPLTPVTQSSTQLYQAGNVQTSHVESKKKLYGICLGFKTLCHVLSVVFCWLRYERSGKRFSHTHLGVWVLVCGGIGHMAHEIAHFSCCRSPLPDLLLTHPSSLLEFIPAS